MFTRFYKEFLIGFDRYQLDLIIYNWLISGEIYVDMLNLNLIWVYEKNLNKFCLHLGIVN